MKIKVTEKHIGEGLAGNAKHCPIALAGLEAIEGATRVRVGFSTMNVQIKGSDRQKFLDLPYEAKTFVRRFDNGDPVKPFEFEIEVAKGA